MNIFLLKRQSKQTRTLLSLVLKMERWPTKAVQLLKNISVFQHVEPMMKNEMTHVFRLTRAQIRAPNESSAVVKHQQSSNFENIPSG